MEAQDKPKAGPGCGQIEEYPPVVFLPGGVLPAKQAWAPLLEMLGREILPVVKELEIYEYSSPPDDYSVRTEVEGIRRAADSAEFDSFHLVGYSAGGAAALAYCERYPARLRSLALIEPAWIFNPDPSPDEYEFMDQLDDAMKMEPAERMRTFLGLQMRPGTEPPAVLHGRQPDWMAQRPAGLMAMWASFKMYSIDYGRLQRFAQPVYYAWGTLSNPAFERMGHALAGVFSQVRVQRFEGLSHLDPPHRAAPEKVAAALRQLWQESEQASQPEAA